MHFSSDHEWDLDRPGTKLRLPVMEDLLRPIGVVRQGKVRVRFVGEVEVESVVPALAWFW